MAIILIIEDNSDNLEVMTCLLDAFGHDTMQARDGVIGLAVAAAETPDLIICDLQIPRLNGYQVCARLKCDPLLKRIPLIAVTAQAMVGDREKILDAGFNGYISKPINPRNFVRQVESYLLAPATEDASDG
jgi:two-component system cell cycle response regulator